MTNARMAICTLSLAIMTSAAPVAARGPGGFGFPGASGPHGPGPSIVLERLLFPCRSACLDAAHTCSDAADDAAVTCIEAACGDTLDAARTACAVDAFSNDCRTATSALKACGEACLTARNEAAGTCRTTGDECLDACTQ